ncbi:hypothetical protein NEUTE1DRAFT_102800 [Neurospora tetrasperma FGSC 2508]|uniref:Uncharacterized protein n=1 Tax=Neurospora tetrasperma (strain FGSC 2508 / ATCC MYA-4615 / P0657) TaxID=510951 RepID=F8MTN8_NEUT8|nr:uncharacterized protein NEUTE1DRAFT_102800 [Neurospora tetrasperma FGSC 2508]EGO55370.1 hypothetical protein NEUTE1DRAFT_102800 [Neurospora tetrasperma FGSC 2508]
MPAERHGTLLSQRCSVTVAINGRRSGEQRGNEGTVGADLRLPEGVGGLYCGPAAREIVTASGPDRFHKTSLGHNTASAGRSTTNYKSPQSSRRMSNLGITGTYAPAGRDGMKRHVAIQNHQAEDKPFQPLR